MLQLSQVPAFRFVERPGREVGRRTLAICLALLIEALLLLLLFTLNSGAPPAGKESTLTVMHLEASTTAEEAAEANGPEREERAEEPPQAPAPKDDPLIPEPAEPPPRPAAPQSVPTAPAVVPPPTVPSMSGIARRTPAPAPSKRAVYGPPDTGGSRLLRDTERVGTAPNGEALYAARWYTEPRPDQLRDYLSTARGPGWGLIACRTAPDYRVEDCVGLAEYPEGSQITPAVLAAAWEFKVRPPQRGGRPLVGSWVRIRIDYNLDRR